MLAGYFGWITRSHICNWSFISILSNPIVGDWHHARQCTGLSLAKTWLFYKNIADNLNRKCCECPRKSSNSNIGSESIYSVTIGAKGTCTLWERLHVNEALNIGRMSSLPHGYVSVVAKAWPHNMHHRRLQGLVQRPRDLPQCPHHFQFRTGYVDAT